MQRADLLRLLRERHREIINALGVGLVTISVPLTGDLRFRVRVTEKPIPVIPRSIHVGGFEVPVEVVERTPVREL